MLTIKTSRLLLVPHTAETIRRWKTDRSEMERFTGRTPYGLQLEDWAMHELETAFDPWLKNIESHPAQAGWYSGWEIVLAAENIGIGGIGCAGPPDENGEIIIGYHVDLRHRRQGIAAEAVAGLTDWAFGLPEVRSVVATIPSWRRSRKRFRA